jgi:2-keto-4-pentenoate hydratase
VAGIAVALEIVDTGRPPHGLEEIIAANVYHRAVAFGPTRPTPTPTGAQARLLIDGHVGEVSPVLAQPQDTVSAIARLLTAAGERLHPGDRILAGSACHLRVKPGDDVVAEIDGLGTVAATIAA